MKAEIQRRSGKTAAVEALFRSEPNRWVSWQAVAEVGGACGWRTRISDVRKRFKAEGGVLIWNADVLASCYMFRPQAPLGRDAGSFTTQPRLWGG